MQMNSLLEIMSGKVLKVHRQGPEAGIGKLLAYNSDFLTLSTENDGVIYYNTQHIKSLSHYTKDNQSNSTETTEDPTYILATNFNDLLRQLQYSWITINKGPDKVEGVLNDFSDDLISVVCGDEVIHLALFHIKTISVGKPKEDDQKQKNKNEDKNKNKNNEKKDQNGKNKKDKK